MYSVFAHPPYFCFVYSVWMAEFRSFDLFCVLCVFVLGSIQTLISSNIVFRSLFWQNSDLVCSVLDLQVFKLLVSNLFYCWNLYFIVEALYFVLPKFPNSMINQRQGLNKN